MSDAKAKSTAKSAGKSSVEENLPAMGLLDHLEELRRRLVYSAVALLIGGGICWIFVRQIFAFLSKPIYRYLPEGEKLVFLGVTDPFLLYFKVSILAALFLCSPYLLYQIYGFIAPGLYRKEKYWVIPFIFFGSLFFVGGAAFAYYIAFPYAVEFLLGIGTDLQAMITVDRYFSFLLTILLGLGLMFELPILIFFLTQMGLTTPRFLMKHFRWAVLVIFVVSAIITPTTDIANLMIFAIPTILLYLLGVAASAVAGGLRRRSRRQNDKALATPTD